MSATIEINNLRKHYGGVRAVDGLSLAVERGEIYGFVGRNGAGKTTTIRAMLGMIRPTAGSVSLFGESVGPHGHGPWRRVGHLVESPAAYPNLTVTENLEITRRLYGVADRSASDRVIALLGLEPYADRRFGKLSSGNRQRLGLARALLHEPDLLILDEPANALDPAGVVEIRGLLASMAHEAGVTVFMSSHILDQVYRLATRIGFIHEGKLIRELGRQALDALGADRLHVAARDMTATEAVLRGAGYAVARSGDRLTLTGDDALTYPDRVATLLVQAGLSPTHLALSKPDLEEQFMALTGGER